MSFLGGSSSSAVAPPPTMDQATKKQAVMDQLRGQVQLANAQALLEKINDKCFLKCVTKPSTSLSSWEQGCLSNCMDRYMEAFDLVSRTYVHRIAEEAKSGSAGLGASSL